MRILGGKLYDTETAESLGYIEMTHPKSHISLYKTKKGAYFIANDDTDSSKMCVLTKQEARDWAEEHLPVDDVIKHFDMKPA